MNSVVCPTLLFIQKNEWNDINKRNIFESTLIQILDYFENNNDKIYWNDILESLLWTNPDLYPWFDSNSYAISNRLSQITCYVPESQEWKECIISPNIKCKISSPNIILPTLSLIHYLIVNNIDFDFLVDNDNLKSFSFSCNCHNCFVTPTIINKFKNPIDLSLEFSTKWNSLDINNTFIDLINLVVKKYFPKEPILYEIKYDRSFIDKIKEQSNFREAIIYAITSRLTKYQKKATQDKSLKDEPVKGNKEHKRRFRVKEANGRIHYIYSNKAIYFTNYYTEKEHDDGL